MAIAATVSMLALFNTQLSPLKRVAPLLFSAPLIVFYNKNIGMYGVQREIDDVLALMVGEDSASEKSDECQVRKMTKQFIKEHGFAQPRQATSLS